MIIYKTINLLNGKIYVGQDSKNNPNYFGSGVYIWSAIKKYGKENFKKEILYECSSKKELNEKEIEWIKRLKCRGPNGYNLTDGGDGVVNLSEESREKMRKPHGPMSEKGKKSLKLARNRPEVLEKNRVPRSEEAKKNMRKPHGPFSEEAKKNMSKSRSEDHKKNIKLSMNRPEIKEKLRKPKSEEAKKNMRKLHGPMSEEGKRKQKIAHNRPEVLEKNRKPRSEEARKNIKLGQQKRRDLEKSKKESTSDSI